MSPFVVAGHCPSWQLDRTVLPSLLWVSRAKSRQVLLRRRRVHGFSHCKLCVCCLSVAFVQRGGIGDPLGPETWTRRWRERSFTLYSNRRQQNSFCSLVTMFYIKKKNIRNSRLDWRLTVRGFVLPGSWSVCTRWQSAVNRQRDCGFTSFPFNTLDACVFFFRLRFTLFTFCLFLYSISRFPRFPSFFGFFFKKKNIGDY